MDEVIARFNARGVRYLVIGGQAARLAGVPRFSMDWDFFIPPHDAANLALINDLLSDELELPLEDLGPQGENFIQTYQTRWGILQFHLGVPGLPDFQQAFARSLLRGNEYGTSVRTLCDDDLLASKKAAARPIDLADIEFLEVKICAHKSNPNPDS